MAGQDPARSGNGFNPTGHYFHMNFTTQLERLQALLISPVDPLLAINSRSDYPRVSVGS